MESSLENPSQNNNSGILAIDPDSLHVLFSFIYQLSRISHELHTNQFLAQLACYSSNINKSVN